MIQISYVQLSDIVLVADDSHLPTLLPKHLPFSVVRKRARSLMGTPKKHSIAEERGVVIPKRKRRGVRDI